MKHILIADDVLQNRLLLKDILMQKGFLVSEATNGEQAVELARQNQPALILMDIQMPILDGYRAIQILKADRETEGIKIIAVTSFAMKGDQAHIMQSGCDAYIAKPINTRALVTKIEQVLAI